ncbi:hypothetical protein BDV39DRAFT_210851 [Aspergillus sergii]|uniref:Uncharacterized protein n=1 Tax=Aspergillus sergii TaxID=1034303 RepID=A0A5N6WNE3_9EURO|nr:hypothetical protein BDV39DRAFT_210851 [Aspergillus sergii]
MTVGRIIHSEIFGSMMGWTCELVEGDLKALSDRMASVQSDRIFAFAQQMNWFDAVQILRQLRPKNTLIADVPEEDIRDRTNVLLRRRAEKLFRMFYGLPGGTSIRNSLEKGI